MSGRARTARYNGSSEGSEAPSFDEDGDGKWSGQDDYSDDDNCNDADDDEDDISGPLPEKHFQNRCSGGTTARKEKDGSKVPVKAKSTRASGSASKKVERGAQYGFPIQAPSDDENEEG